MEERDKLSPEKGLIFSRESPISSISSFSDCLGFAIHLEYRGARETLYVVRAGTLSSSPLKIDAHSFTFENGEERTLINEVDRKGKNRREYHWVPNLPEFFGRVPGWLKKKSNKILGH